MGTGGFDFHVLGKRISVHTIGNSGYVVLYLLLARWWYLHHRGRIDWHALTSVDLRVRPLLMFFALPVTIWLASPYPNHIRDFANLVINRPLGESSVEAGVVTYVDALRDAYFFSQWISIAVVAVFVIAAATYRQQRPVIQWLILSIPLQLVAIAIHQTRFPRFLLLTVVLLDVVAASEIGRWFDRRRLRVPAVVVAVLLLVSGVLVARRVVAEPRFHDVAFENYTDSDALRAALDSIRAGLTPEDRLAIVGQSNELSPALLRWELGPPSGVACFPFEIGGAQGRDLRLATKVLLIVAVAGGEAALDQTSYYAAQRQAVLELVTRGELVLGREFPIIDRHILLRLYRRSTASDQSTSCE